ncbi:MAG: flagellar protein FlaG [Pseudohongiellaceae bacterium]
MTSPITDTMATSRAAMPSRPSQTERVDHALDQLDARDAQQTTEPQKDELLKPVERINEALQSYDVQFRLSEHDSRVITSVIDRESGDVIRQIPAEAVLRIAERLPELQGLLLQEKT